MTDFNPDGRISDPLLDIISAYAAAHRDDDTMITQKEIIERFCSLRGLVRLIDRGPADCICGETGIDPYGFQDDGVTLRFIEEATLVAFAEATGRTLDEAHLRLAQYRGEA